MNSENHIKSIISHEDIEVISTLLITLETVLFNVGIPLLPENADRCKLKQKYFSPCDEFIKSSLVTVSTSNLYEYIELLDNRSQDEKARDLVGKSLAMKKLYEVIFFPFVVVVLTFTFVLPISFPYSGSTMSAILSATFTTLGALAGATFSTSEQYRYYTFKNILKSEISRREGKIGFLPTRKIPLTNLQMSETKTEKTLC